MAARNCRFDTTNWILILLLSGLGISASQLAYEPDVQVVELCTISQRGNLIRTSCILSNENKTSAALCRGLTKVDLADYAIHSIATLRGLSHLSEACELAWRHWISGTEFWRVTSMDLHGVLYNLIASDFCECTEDSNCSSYCAVADIT